MYCTPLSGNARQLFINAIALLTFTLWFGISLMAMSNTASAQSHPAASSATPATDTTDTAGNIHHNLPDMFATLSVTQLDAFVSEQLSLQLEILTPTAAFNVRRPKLLIEGAEVYVLRKTTGRIQRDEQPYDRQQFDYAVFFKKPGTYQIPALKVTATLPVSAGGVNATTNPTISAFTTAHNLTITDAPVSASQWLPAASLELKSVWPDDIPATAGQPLALEYQVTITGQHPAAIPAISYPQLAWARQYANPPVVTSLTDADTVAGTLRQTVNVIPERAGTFTVPPVAIHWWDINNKEWQQATVPQQHMAVQPNTVTGNIRTSTHTTWLTWLLACTTLLFAAISVWLLLRLRNHTQALTAPTEVTEKKAWRDLQQALKRRHAGQVRQALLVWYKAIDPSAVNPRLEQLAQCHDGLGPHLQQLDESIYRTDTGKDHGAHAPDYAAIAHAVVALRKTMRGVKRGPIHKHGRNHTVDELYPGGR